MNRLKFTIVVVFFCVFFANDISVSAQSSLDYTLIPTFGSVSLSAGFTPDPYTIQLISGGSINVDNVFSASSSAACTGFAAAAPDYRLYWDGYTSLLEFDFIADDDTVMIVNDPNRGWWCDDDGGSGLNPNMSFSEPLVGTYNIWIASYSRNDNLAGTLFISDNTSPRTNASAGLDSTNTPNFGSATLRAGFTPDPYTIQLTSGGTVDLDDLFTGDDCRGYASESPDFRISWSGATSRLQFDFIADEDTVMVVRDPNSDWYCNDDDGEGLNPMVGLNDPISGTYNIWIGSYTYGDYISGTLAISDNTSLNSTNNNGLDYTLTPNFGTASLRAGFRPDPYQVYIISGGSVNVDNFLDGTYCLGYATAAPDFELTWSGDASRLEFEFDGDGDTVMVINDPLGGWYCDDDNGDGVDPRIVFNNPQTGAYDVWIASYSAGDSIGGTLFISD